MERIQKQLDAMSERKRWDRTTDEWEEQTKEVAEPEFGGTASEWKRWCSENEGPNSSQIIFFSKHELLGVRIHLKLAVAVRYPSENQWPESCVAHAAITTSTTNNNHNDCSYETGEVMEDFMKNPSYDPLRGSWDTSIDWEKSWRETY